MGSLTVVDTFTHDGHLFEVLDGGPAGVPTVVLLHGFPQDATAYDEVAGRLRAHGLRTLALHQRGYSRGARPRRAAAYRMQHLVGDGLALLDAAGLERAHVVGHDWGGAVAWALAQSHPERVASLVVLSTPHPAALARALRHDPDQLRRSWYMLAFQAPWTPELAMARMMRAGALVRQGLPPEHADRYAARLGRAADLRGPINWYRAAMRPGLPRPASGRWHTLEEPAAATVRVPTTFVWGRRDPYLGRAAAEGTAEHVGPDYRFVEVDAGHWLPEKEADLVADEVLARVASSS